MWIMRIFVPWLVFLHGRDVLSKEFPEKAFDLAAVRHVRRFIL